MKKLILLSLAAAAAALLTSVSMPEPATAQQAKSKAKNQALRGVVRPSPRRGGYSYSVPESIDTRKFTDPTIQAQTRNGPFDSGFFFSSPANPRGGDSPYMQ
ncbi:hypothetical protein W911_02915 [Hyphomicrobium nitrativorans NL23]|uniref:Uncharacterized protein n=1 Tax=Hyphomicrobium nitrativorans NL23 TaxID=1029756 RepID=V5SA29_9HYPH|nr:hypothetical protein [Hyphomicrobium nitrativorans]AHB47596.1 hypothetical protein W911_02915 [Hyphomicrobium nitrativorans NL23]